jgi:hypothetical protein
MKTIITSIFAFVIFCTTAFADKIIISSPVSETGSSQKIIRIIDKGLAEKGWDFDIKITGNAMLSKQTSEDATGKFILAWGYDINRSKNDPSYLAPATADNLIGTTHFSNLFICSQGGLTLDNLKDNSKQYKIGNVVDYLFNKWLASLQEYLGTNHKIVKYKGSNKVGNALISGEVDFILSSKGAKMQAKEQATCILGMGYDSVLNIPTAKTVFPDFEGNLFFVGMYWQAINFDAKSLEKLRKDFQEVLNTSEDLKALLNSRYAGQVKISIDEQVKVIESFDKNLD